MFRGLLLRLNTLGRTPLDERSAGRRYMCLYNTQHSQTTDIHALRRDSNPQSQKASSRRPTP